MLTKLDPTERLVVEIKSLLNCADRAMTDAENWYRQAGQRLADLKAQKPDGVTWETYVKEQCGISKNRADELIRIATGKTTLDEVRQNNKEKQDRFRKKERELRNAHGSGPTQTDIEDALASIDPDEPTLDDEAMGRIAKPKRLPDDTPHENLETAYMIRIDLTTNAIRGCENIVGDLPKNFPRKMKRNMADAARAAAEAWSALALTLEKSLRNAEGSMQLDGLDGDPTNQPHQPAAL
jgi:hypothetical protein